MRDRLQRLWRASASLAILVFGGATLYALSIGPATWLMDQLGPKDQRFIEFCALVYYPITWLCERSEFAKVFFTWYQGLWT